MMNQTSLVITRSIFSLLSLILFTVFSVSANLTGIPVLNWVVGLILGGGTAVALAFLQHNQQKHNFRIFCSITLGLLVGFLMAEVLWLIVSSALSVADLALPLETVGIVKITLFIFSTYFGVTFTQDAMIELGLAPTADTDEVSPNRKSDILTDISILQDPRLIDLALSGLLDTKLVIPRFIVHEIQEKNEGTDEGQKGRYRRAFDAIKKLEVMEDLSMRYVDIDYPELSDPLTKLARYAKEVKACILTADMGRIQQAELEGVKVINLHTLSHSLKPLTQAGEFITIKIQRYGKEARQGVGYLDDGTMVVVNGGAEYIGDAIKAQVLSVKHTSSGRMIFCNALEEEGMEEDPHAPPITVGATAGETSHKNYFAL